MRKKPTHLDLLDIIVEQQIEINDLKRRLNERSGVPQDERATPAGTGTIYMYNELLKEFGAKAANPTTETGRRDEQDGV